MKRSMRIAAATLTAALFAVGLAACSPGGGSDTSAAGKPADLDAALSKGGEITYWAWAPAGEAKAKAFEAKYPNVKVNYVNAGSGVDEYTKITNALKAGTGAPDVAQIEYTAMPQFYLAKSLVDLSSYGFGDLKSDFIPGSWGAVADGEKVYGLPEDSGPMAMFYNQRVFDQYGITVPTTWDEFSAAAEKLHAADPNQYLTSDGGDGYFASSMIWQAGGHPYQVDGTKVTIDLQDEGTKKWTGVWNNLVEKKLLSPTPSYTDDWYKQLGNGQIAALISGAWMPSLLESAAPEGAGDWRAAPMPTYDGTAASANFGGSAQGVLSQSKNPALAAAFVKWMNDSPEGVKVLQDSGSFPSTVSDLKAPDFADATSDYFGGQQVNKVLLAASETVPDGWQYLPYQTYAQTIFADSVGQAYANNSDLNPGLKKWQETLVSYGNEQGFTVTGK
ncbi:sugar ABC transporter substrate-binding protein [Agreia pratensis]|nr:sugar ABC transporter substrate-binding protein [Agreia pratensis]